MMELTTRERATIKLLHHALFCPDCSIATTGPDDGAPNDSFFDRPKDHAHILEDPSRWDLCSVGEAWRRAATP